MLPDEMSITSRGNLPTIRRVVREGCPRRLQPRLPCELPAPRCWVSPCSVARLLPTSPSSLYSSTELRTTARLRPGFQFRSPAISRLGNRPLMTPMHHDAGNKEPCGGLAPRCCPTDFLDAHTCLKF